MLSRDELEEGKRLARAAAASDEALHAWLEKHEQQLSDGSGELNEMVRALVWLTHTEDTAPLTDTDAVNGLLRHAESLGWKPAGAPPLSHDIEFGTDPEDSARLLALYDAIDKHLGWQNPTDQERGDYLGRLVQVGDTLRRSGLGHLLTDLVDPTP